MNGMRRLVQKRVTYRGLAVLTSALMANEVTSVVSFADVSSVPILQPVMEKRQKKIIAKSTVASHRQRGKFFEWVKANSMKLLSHFATATRKSAQFVKYLHRFVTIMVLGAPMALLGPLAYFTGGYFPTIQDLAMQYGVWAMEALGPAFVKLGQWASTRPDLYPPRVVSRLSALQDDVKVHYSMERVEQTLTENLGKGWKDFLELDPNPIGAGCIAQVFKGILNTPNTKNEAVAVKVIHPHVKDLLQTDMELLTLFADFLDVFPNLKLLSIGDACRGFCNSMNEQLDMKKEAYNMIHFGRKFEKETWAKFPVPFQDLTTSNVLVETLMSGTSITKFMELKEDIDGVVDEKVKLLKRKLSDICSKTMIKMIFFDNFIHGDLHPGNILVNVDKETGEPSLVLLDTGIVFASKDEEDHDNIVNICIAFMQHDGRKAARLMLEERDRLLETITPSDGASGAQGFIDGVQELVDSAEHHSYFEHVGEYVGKMCELAREHKVKLNPGYFHIAMALKVTEGISLALDRDLDLISACLPVIVKAKAMQKMGMGPVFGDIDTQAEAKKEGALVRIAKIDGVQNSIDKDRK